MLCVVILATGEFDLSAQEKPASEAAAAGSSTPTPAETIVKVQVPVTTVAEAMDRLSKEVQPVVKAEKVLIVWLIDRSDSCTELVKELSAAMPRFVQKLQAVSPPAPATKSKKEELPQVIMDVIGFGGVAQGMLRKPATTAREVTAALGQLGIDGSGKELTLTSLSGAIEGHRKKPYMLKRKPIVVLLTDESGDDDLPTGDLLERTIKKVQDAKGRVYLLGQEARFSGSQLRYRKVIDGLTHWLPKTLGPESAEPEICFDDPLREGNDNWATFSSRFGPYSQLRLCKETGGVYFLLPSAEEDLIGQEKVDLRVARLAAATAYAPELTSREKYRKDRNSSAFRRTISEAIRALDSGLNPKLRFRATYSPLDPKAFRMMWEPNGPVILALMRKIDEQLAALDAVADQKPRETSLRWRANYELVHAQLLLHKVRLCDLLMAAEELPNRADRPKPESTHWFLSPSTEVQPFNAALAARLKIEQAVIDTQRSSAIAELNAIIKQHPTTPWAQFAEYELSVGSSVKFIEYQRPR